MIAEAGKPRPRRTDRSSSSPKAWETEAPMVYAPVWVQVQRQEQINVSAQRWPDRKNSSLFSLLFYPGLQQIRGGPLPFGRALCFARSTGSSRNTLTYAIIMCNRISRHLVTPSNWHRKLTIAEGLISMEKWWKSLLILDLKGKESTVNPLSIICRFCVDVLYYVYKVLLQSYLAEFFSWAWSGFCQMSL